MLIQICNKYNVARIIFDSYVKLIPGSMNKDDDVKRMLNNWSMIHGSTNIRESFWVGHINNTGEVRSSGSILLDGTFESLLAITVDATGRRFFQAQAGRLTDEFEPTEITLDHDTKRPIINVGSAVRPVDPEAKPPRGAKGAAAAEEVQTQNESTETIVLQLMGRIGPVALRDGKMRRGGYAKDDLVKDVISQWQAYARWVPQASKTAILSTILEMVGSGLLVNEHPVKGVKKLWLSETGDERFFGLQS